MTEYISKTVITLVVLKTESIFLVLKYIFQRLPI